YTGLQKEDLPQLVQDDGKVIIHPVSGNWFDTAGPVKPYTDIELSWIEIQTGGNFSYSVASTKNIFLYIVKGEISINDQMAAMHHLVEFAREGEEILIKAVTNAVILFGHATPINEPLVARGPFVMNTKEEISQAYDDYKKGLFGNEAALYA
ncbi:MAG TPA: pirin-like C-terminal cupin domain-containing protein, partial [Flavisolibacter sp.]|nr:pirin-like C-terminal cupin domain-containing protein [Flavisolibacter sp.]